MQHAAPSRGRGRPSSKDSPVTEDQVLTTALKAFATYGYDSVSFRDLAKDLGVSHNLLHQKYGSKLALWYAAVDRAFAPFVASLIDLPKVETDPLDHLRSFIEGFAFYSARHPDVLRLVNIEGSIPGERLDYICHKYILPVYRELLPTYRRLVADGTLRRVPIVTLYYMIASGSGAMFTNADLTEKLFGEAPLRATNHRKQARASAKLIIDGLRMR